MRDGFRPDDPNGDSPFSSFLRQKPGRSRGTVIAVVIATIALAGLGWYLLADREAGQEPEAERGLQPAPERPPPVATLDTVEPLELPPLDASDDFVRRVVTALSTHPQFAQWLVTDDLVRRFVATVVDLAHGSSPARQLRFMTPATAFTVRDPDASALIDPASFRRYDAITDVFTSLDTRGTARLVRQLEPLFEEVHRELGFPKETFNRDLASAVNNLLAVDVDDTTPAVVRVEDAWLWADPALEARSPAAKHLMRMGPQNARRVQAKLAELAAALRIQTG